MKTAIIGHTGFVGSNVLLSHQFDEAYNSSNMHEIAGKKYDLVVSAANRADSFRINEHPDDDRAEILAFADALKNTSIAKLVLISTVCVYEASARSDEDALITPANITPYGRNRYELETILRDRFDTTVLRLPQLYGSGMKKGVVYDLANGHRVEYIQPTRVFQHYDLGRLWADIEVALRHRVQILNLATPPISNERIARECFGISLSTDISVAPDSRFAQMYTRNMTTKYAALFDRRGDYLMTEEEEIDSIKQFLIDDPREPS